MALKAGRVGVRPDQVDRYGRIKNGGDITSLVATIKSELSKDFPLIGKKWYKVDVEGDGTDYSGVTDYPTGSLEFHTSLVLLPAGVVPTGVIFGMAGRTTGGSSNTYNNDAIQFGYSNTANTRVGFRLPAKTVNFHLRFWFCVD